MKNRRLFKCVKQLENKSTTLAIKYENELLKAKYSKLWRIMILNKHFKKVSLSRILRILQIPRSTYYYDKQATTLPNKDKLILNQIKGIKNGNYHRVLGYRPVTAYLKFRGFKINHKRVLRIMKQYRLTSNYYNRKHRKYNSDKGSVGKVTPNLLDRDFKAKLPYEKLTTDVSEFRYGCGDFSHRVYLSPVMDLHSDLILAYNISKHPTVEFTLKSLREALDKRPTDLKYRTIVHSDQVFSIKTSAG